MTGAFTSGVFGGSAVQIVISAQDDFSTTLKKAGNSLKTLSTDAKVTGATVVSSGSQMSQSVNNFGTGTEKALTKTQKVLANFGGSWGRIASSFSLGAGLMAGASAMLALKIWKDSKENMKAFQDFDKFSAEVSGRFYTNMKGMSDASREFNGLMKANTEVMKEWAIVQGAGSTWTGAYDQLMTDVALRKLAEKNVQDKLKSEGKWHQGMTTMAMPETQAEYERLKTERDERAKKYAEDKARLDADTLEANKDLEAFAQRRVELQRQYNDESLKDVPNQQLLVDLKGKMGAMDDVQKNMDSAHNAVLSDFIAKHSKILDVKVLSSNTPMVKPEEVQTAKELLTTLREAYALKDGGIAAFAKSKEIKSNLGGLRTMGAGASFTTTTGREASIATARALKSAPAKSSSLKGSVKKMASGGFILSEGLAYLHKNETVVPAGKSAGNNVSITMNNNINSELDIDRISEELCIKVRRELCYG